ncbi:uncharacterized protein LOC124162718 [Ischnura elegans]|uniref:uncharacterized protein LOC124162718 n=1 Tax=Ischnura elegans TaxID=197161 RepID=UPI001ED8B56E|nr:uncharacterized protein LOC124162718 [Ischnura elegans]
MFRKSFMDMGARHKRRLRGCVPRDANLSECSELEVELKEETEVFGEGFIVIDGPNSAEGINCGIEGTTFACSSSSESDSGDSIDADEGENFLCDLKEWALSGITHTKVDELLKILKKHPCHSNLPSNARTLLATPRSNNIKNVGSGKYVHVGIANSIKEILRDHPETRETRELKLQCSVDGVPLAKSSASQAWPILMAMAEFHAISPWLVGIYHGYEKPSSCDEFFSDFVDEMRQIKCEGINFNGTTYSVHIDAYVCDAPARAFAAQIKGHNAYFGCGKCTVEGTFIQNRVVFDEVNSPKRTDDGFSGRVQQEHHNGQSPLERIPGTLMVTSFPFEYMHLVCLGVVRKMLLAFTRGNLGVRMNSRALSSVSSRLNQISCFVPHEFARKPRSMSYILRWKATEFRQFLLYTGPLALLGITSDDVMKHFLILHVAIRILVSKEYHADLTMRKYSKDLLQFFVTHFCVLYGQENVSYNVHGLIHLTDDSDHLGPLDRFSAFRFENYLQVIKKSIRKHNAPLQQIINRVSERKLHYAKGKLEESSCNNKMKVRKIQCDNDHALNVKSPCYSHCILDCGKVTTKSPDNCVVMDDGSVVIVDHIATGNIGIVVVGRKFKSMASFYDSPINSNEVGIFKASDLSLEMLWPLNSIRHKGMCVPNVTLESSESYYVAVMLHQ